MPVCRPITARGSSADLKRVSGSSWQWRTYRTDGSDQQGRFPSRHGIGGETATMAGVSNVRAASDSGLPLRGVKPGGGRGDLGRLPNQPWPALISGRNCSRRPALGPASRSARPRRERRGKTARLPSRRFTKRIRCGVPLWGRAQDHCVHRTAPDRGGREDSPALRAVGRTTASGSTAGRDVDRGVRLRRRRAG